LDNVKFCAICADNHDIEICPSLSGLQAIYQGSNGAVEPYIQAAQRSPWKPCPQGMAQDHSFQFYASYNSYPQ
jgi:hypothetical protein